MLEFIDTSSLRIGYLASGDEDGWPVVLMHGFPYDVHAYDEVREQLSTAGARIFVPYLRGYGPTQFLHSDTPRSGEQAAFGHDLKEFIEQLGLKRPIVAGYDWGGRGACVVAALWPEMVSGLVSCNSYNIQNIAKAMEPAAPDQEHRLWYQYYFHSERGRAGLTVNRNALCRLWTLWSPTWSFSDSTYQQSAESFENPDFVGVVIHSYRHRYSLVPGDPQLAGIERRLAAQPKISIPAVTLDGSDDGVSGHSTASHSNQFVGRHEHLTVVGAGHNLPQEFPEVFASAIIKCHSWATR